MENNEPITPAPENSLSPSEIGKAMSRLGSAKGGRAHANALTPEQRAEIGAKAIRTRWIKAGKIKEVESPKTEDGSKQPSAEAVALPYSMFRGNIKLGNVELECHVLNDGRRVFTQGEIVKALTFKEGEESANSRGTDSSNLARYLSRNPLIANELVGGPIQFQIPKNPQIALGSEATLLVEICDKYLQAMDDKLLRPSQYKLVAQAGIIVRACAKVGIIALVDEATGYQQVRQRNALQLKLQAFIADEMQEWARMFPEEFWMELARLESIHYSPRSRPLRWGKYVMMFVYDAIDGDVGQRLREKNPNPRFLKNHHQWLKKFGRDRVNNQIQQDIAIMKLCTNMEDFRSKFAHVFKKTPLQLQFEDLGWNVNGS